jgi:hypothetical protein
MEHVPVRLNKPAEPKAEKRIGHYMAAMGCGIIWVEIVGASNQVARPSRIEHIRRAGHAVD